MYPRKAKGEGGSDNFALRAHRCMELLKCTFAPGCGICMATRGFFLNVHVQMYMYSYFLMAAEIIYNILKEKNNLDDVNEV